MVGRLGKLHGVLRVAQTLGETTHRRQRFGQQTACEDGRQDWQTQVIVRQRAGQAGDDALEDLDRTRKIPESQVCPAGIHARHRPQWDVAELLGQGMRPRRLDSIGARSKVPRRSGSSPEGEGPPRVAIVAHLLGQGLRAQVRQRSVVVAKERQRTRRSRRTSASQEFPLTRCLRA
jgi:hypothetical protein